MATSRIGMIATCSTTYTEPYNLARQFSSLDHISRGRVGWNIVTTWSHQAGSNYGGIGQVSHADRYERAEEYMAVVNGLWDSWADDAVKDDRARGLYADPAKVRAIDHAGPLYQVKGPLNLPRSPQGRPVFVQAGSSDTGRKFAARHAEAVFTAHMEKATAKTFYSDLKGLLAGEGRNPEDVLILPGFSPIIGSTMAEAERYSQELNDLADPEIGRMRMSGRFGGFDFSHIPLDKVLTPEDFPPPETVEAARSRTEVIIGFVRNEQSDPSPAAVEARWSARTFHVRRDARAVRRPHAGLDGDGGRRRLQPDAAGVAAHARRVHRGGGADFAKARPLPHGLRGGHAARPLRAVAAGGVNGGIAGLVQAAAGR